MNAMRVVPWIVVACSMVAAQSQAQEAPTLCSVPRPTVEAYRLLFNSVVTPEGLLVTSIQPDSPVLRLQSADVNNLRGVLQLGDVITAVNGQPIPEIEEYHRIMEASDARGGLVELTVRDRNTGDLHRWMAQARKILIPLAGQAGSTLRKAHFLLVGLTNDNKIGPAMEDTLALWQRPIESMDRERHGNIRILKGDECQARSILDAVEAMEVAARDTVFCVYCGHGAFDPARATPDDPSRGHHFQIRPSGDLMRKDLSDALMAKGARLTVLISDTCNIEDIARPALPMVAEERTVMVMGLAPFEQLLFNYRGVVDISGTDFGQYGFCQPGYGAWFSAATVPVIELQSDWRNGFEQIRRVVENDFQQKRFLHGIAQAKMTPTAFRLDVYRDEPVVALAAEEPPRLKEVRYGVRRAAVP